MQVKVKINLIINDWNEDTSENELYKLFDNIDCDNLYISNEIDEPDLFL